MYYLICKQERGAADRFLSDKARIASILNSFKNDPFYTHLVSLQKNCHYRCCVSQENRGISFVKIYMCFITYKDSFKAMISFVFMRIINECLKIVYSDEILYDAACRHRANLFFVAFATL